MWMHNRCRLIECAMCRRESGRERREQIGLNGESFECVIEFPYLQDVICTGDGANGSEMVTIRGKCWRLAWRVTIR